MPDCFDNLVAIQPSEVARHVGRREKSHRQIALSFRRFGCVARSQCGGWRCRFRRVHRARCRLRRPFLMVGHPFVEDSITTPIRRCEDGLFHSLRGALRGLLPLRAIRSMLPDCEWCTNWIDGQKAFPSAHVNTGMTVASNLPRQRRWAGNYRLDTNPISGAIGPVD